MLSGKGRSARRTLDLATGDEVQVITGRDKGKQGQILRTLPSQGKVVVQGVNIVKRHVKAGQRAGGNRVMQGGIVDFEAPVDRSNVMLVCPSCHKPTRIRNVVLSSGARAIECLHCGEPYERVRQAKEES